MNENHEARVKRKIQGLDNRILILFLRLLLVGFILGISGDQFGCVMFLIVEKTKKVREQ